MAREFKPGEFCWVDLMSVDIQAAKAFYAAVFGWTHEAAPGPTPYVFFHKDGELAAGAGQASPEMMAQGVKSTWNDYVSVTDIDATASSVVANGGSVVFPPQDAGGVGKLAFFADPDGAGFAAWQPTGHAGAAVTDADGSMCWHEVAVTDLLVAAAFYTAVFGWDCVAHDRVPTGYRLCEVNGEAEGGILQMNEAWEGVDPNWMTYFAVNDCAGAADRCAAAGGVVTAGPFETPVGRIAVLTDPGGAVFSVIERVDD